MLRLIDPTLAQKIPANREKSLVGYKRPPLAHRFKPGQSGNPTGRPKILTEKSKSYLEQKDEKGITNAEKIVRSMGNAAQMSDKPHCVNAARTLLVRRDG